LSHPNERAERLRRLRDNMAEARIDLVTIAPGADMFYLLGFSPRADERVCALFIGPQAICFVIPSLNAEQAAAHTDVELVTWDDADGSEGVLRATSQRFPRVRTWAVDATMRADTLVPLRNALRPEELRLAVQVLDPLRLNKSARELDCLRRSAELADRAVAAGFETCRPGCTEADVARVIEDCFHAGGASQTDFAIVAFGANAAFPHHHTGETTLRAGDAVLIDTGGTLAGYKSDITRMAHVGPPPEEFARAHAAVLEANRQARATVRPGVKACDVDAAARDLLTARDLGDQFVHRTGHGLGLDGHEQPYISASSETVLEPGMVFSIEPGVYLPGRFGIRIEDIVAVSEDGAELLTGAPHELLLL